MTATTHTEREPAQQSRKNGKRIVVPPGTTSFEEAVKKAWEAEPPKRKEREKKSA